GNPSSPRLAAVGCLHFTSHGLPPSPRGAFFSNDPPAAETFPLSLHDALPIFVAAPGRTGLVITALAAGVALVLLIAGLIRSNERSEEHTSELQSLTNLVCRLLLEKKNTTSHRTRSLSYSCLSRARPSPPFRSC